MIQDDLLEAKRLALIGDLERAFLRRGQEIADLVEELVIAKSKPPKQWYGEGYGNELVNRAIYHDDFNFGEEWSKDDILCLIYAILDHNDFEPNHRAEIIEEIRGRWPEKTNAR